MRIKLKLLVEGNEITTEYRRAFMHYFKSALQLLEGVQAYDMFYNDDLKSRGLTFAFKFAEPKFGKDKITLGSNVVEVNISTAELKKALVINNAFTKLLHKNVKFADGNIKLTSISINEGKTVANNEIFIKMMSPLCVREHSTEKSDFYYSVNNEKFEEKANYLLKEQIKNELDLIDVNFKIEKINNKKTVVTHYEQKIESSIGEFKLTGDIKILQYLYDNGIGSRKSAGFGMFDFV